MTFRTIVLAALICAGCYSPRFKNEIACDPSGDCPPGTTCGVDGRCHGPGGEIFDAPVATDALAADAVAVDAVPVDAAIDARPVGCAGDGDCTMPPDLCSKAGTCDLNTHVCAFKPVDCSNLNDECSRGTCDAATGQCGKTPINGGVNCGAGTVCGAFGACGGFDAVCDTTGTQTRSCTQHTCQAGACTPNTFSETQSCNRTVTTCGTPTVTNCTACDYTSQCDESASQTCTCTDFNCQGGTCVAVPTSCTQTCTRSTEGDPCGSCVNFRTKECQSGNCVTTDC